MAEWVANQMTEACGWEQIPRYLVRDRDGAYGEIFVRRVRSIGIRDRPTSPRSLWQNAYAERLIGLIRRECVDHIVVFGERHLRHVLHSYMSYYNGTRTHLSLNKDAPKSRAAETAVRWHRAGFRSYWRWKSRARGGLLLSYMNYYNEARTHLSLEKDSPVSRNVERAGHILCRPVLGGLHHLYLRI
ncbi:integrase core domain-containing protein [Nitrobacter sp. TKz-YC02]|uniref:integrase core domain-containing protein n=1 Tax=Nitrobacter sp. TKz-YC02 TaxID=3398704 RepID=UPI003CEB8EE0